MSLVFDQDRLIRYCSIACLSSVVGLLAIWVLPNTIALRHVFLGIGFIAAIPLILKTQFLSRKSIWELLPLLLLLALFIWVIAHLTFFSLDFDLELKELKTLWARAFLGAVLAIGLSIAIQRDSKLQPPFFVALFIVSALNIEAYLYMCAKAGSFISFREYVWTFVFKKIEAAYFGVLAISIACANIVYLLSTPASKRRASVIAWWLLGVLIALIASIINITKNGIAIGVGLCTLLALTYFARTLFHESRSGLKIFLSLGVIAVITLGGWQINHLFSSPGLSNFVDDIKISSRIDEHSYWKKNNSTVFPINSSGVMVSGSSRPSAAARASSRAAATISSCPP